MNPQPKPIVIRDKGYLEWLLTLPPKIGSPTQVYHHQTIHVPCSCKGWAQKDHDVWAIPISNMAHDSINYGNLIIEDKDKAVYVIDLWLKYADYKGLTKLRDVIVELNKTKNVLEIINEITPRWKELTNDNNELDKKRRKTRS